MKIRSLVIPFCPYVSTGFQVRRLLELSQSRGCYNIFTFFIFSPVVIVYFVIAVNFYKS